MVLLNHQMITYGGKDLASDPLPAADIFPGLQVASDALVSTEAAQHPCVCGTGRTRNKPSRKHAVPPKASSVDSLFYSVLL